MGRIILKYNPSTGKVEEYSESTPKGRDTVLIKKSRPGLKWTHKHGNKLKK
jgi:hypothetical protein